MTLVTLVSGHIVSATPVCRGYRVKVLDGTISVTPRRMFVHRYPGTIDELDVRIPTVVSSYMALAAEDARTVDVEGLPVGDFTIVPSFQVGRDIVEAPGQLRTTVQAHARLYVRMRTQTHQKRRFLRRWTKVPALEQFQTTAEPRPGLGTRSGPDGS